MRPLAALFVTSLLTLSTSAWSCDDHASGRGGSRQPAARAASWAEGQVLEIDSDQRTVALRHGKIRNLRMAPMGSMVFKASEGKVFANLQPGDNVRFQATLADLQPTITRIEPSKARAARAGETAAGRP